MMFVIRQATANKGITIAPTRALLPPMLLVWVLFTAMTLSPKS